jgi:tetratricopeptide (TPR) repeat protein
MTNNSKAKDLYTEAMGYFVSDNYDDAIRLLGEAIAEDGTFTLAVVSRGAAHLKVNDADGAIADFDHALTLDGDNARTYHLRGLAHEMKGNADAAEADFNRAIDINPEYGAAYFSRATLKTKSGKEEEAIEDMQMVAHLTNRNIEEFANDNNVWRSQHLRLEEAIESEMQR